MGRRFKSDLQPEQSNAETILSILSIPVHSKAEWIDQAIDRDRSLSRAPTSDIEYAMSPRSLMLGPLGFLGTRRFVDQSRIASSRRALRVVFAFRACNRQGSLQKRQRLQRKLALEPRSK